MSTTNRSPNAPTHTWAEWIAWAWDELTKTGMHFILGAGAVVILFIAALCIWAR